MTTYYLQMVEKVRLLEDELKGNLWPPHSPLDLLRDWEIGLWLWVCVSVWECVGVCMSVRACLFVSMYVYEKVCVSLYVCKCTCLCGCVSVYFACVVWVTCGYECVWLCVCVSMHMSACLGTQYLEKKPPSSTSYCFPDTMTRNGSTI